MAKSVYSILIELEGNESAKKGITELGTAVGLTGAALTAFTLKVNEAAQNYEEAMTKVSTVSTDATGTTSELDTRFAELSKTLDGNLSKTEAATAAYDVLSAGFAEQADVLTIVEKSQKGAIAGFSDLASVSDLSTTIMNAFGDSLGEGLTVAEKMDIIMNQLINTQNVGKVTIDQYAQSFGNVAASISNSGVSFTEANSAIAAITAKTGNATMAFRDFNQALASISKPSVQAQELAKELGIQFDSTALSSMGFTGVLEQIATRTDITNGELLTLFGSTEAVRAIAPLLGEGFDKYTEALESNANATGLLDDAYNKMADTANQKFKAALNQLQNAMVDMGRGVMVATTPIIEVLGKLIAAFNELPQPVKEFLGAAIALTGVTATLGGGMLILAAQFGGLLGTFKDGYKVISSLGEPLLDLADNLLESGTKSVLAARNAAILDIQWKQLGKSLTLVGKQVLTSIGSLIEVTKAATISGIKYASTTNVITASQLKSVSAGNLWTATTVKATAANNALQTSMGRTITMLGALGAAIGAVILLQQDMANRNTEMANIEAFGNLEKTEVFSTKIQELSARMRESGDAIPQAEFDRWIDLFSQSGNESLKGMVEALKRQRQALIDSGGSAGVAARKQEDLNKATEELIETQDKAISSTRSYYDAKISMAEATAQSEEDSIRAVTQIQRESLNQQIRMTRDKLKDENLSKEQRQQINNELANLNAERIKAEKEAAERLLEIAVNKSESVLQIENNEIKQRRTLNQSNQLEYLSQVQASVQREIGYRREVAEYRMSLAKKDSAEYLALEAELSDLSLQEAENRVNTERELNTEIDAINNSMLASRRSQIDALTQTNRISTEQSIQLRRDEARLTYETLYESIQAQIDLTAEGSSERANLEAELSKATADYAIETTNLLREEAEKRVEDVKLSTDRQLQEFERLNQLGSIIQSAGQAYDSYLGSVSGVLGTISSQLDDENLSSQERNRLLQVAQTGLAGLRDLGIQVSGQGTIQEQIQEAQLDIQMAQLQIKQSELDVQHSLNMMAIEKQRIDLESQLIQEKILANSGTLSDVELARNQANQQALQSNLQLLDRQTAAQHQNFELQRQSLNLQQQLVSAQGGNGFSQSALNQDVAGSRQDRQEFFQGADQLTSPAPEQVANTVASALKVANQESLVPALNQVSTSSQALVESTQANQQATQQASAKANQALQQGLSQLISEANQINGKLSTVIDQLIGLPSAIASRIPRPSPAPSSR